MKEKIGVTDHFVGEVTDPNVEEVTDKRLRVWIKNFLVKFIIWLKNSNKYTRGIAIVTGQVRDELFDPKTGKTIRTVYPITLANFNAVQNQLLYNLAKWIGASNTTAWVGGSSLMTQASPTGKDGIGETDSDYAYTTTKDSGGTGSQDNVVFKGVRTAAGSESHVTLELGIIWGASAFVQSYATQTISKSLTTAQVYTVYWTFTIS